MFYSSVSSPGVFPAINSSGNYVVKYVSYRMPVKTSPNPWNQSEPTTFESLSLRAPFGGQDQDMQHPTNTHVFTFATQIDLDKSLNLDPTSSGSRNRQHGSSVKFTCFNALAVCPFARDERNRRGPTQQHYEKHEPLARPSLQRCHSPNSKI
jgi:hypothetical protein